MINKDAAVRAKAAGIYVIMSKCIMKETLNRSVKGVFKQGSALNPVKQENFLIRKGKV